MEDASQAGKQRCHFGNRAELFSESLGSGGETGDVVGGGPPGGVFQGQSEPHAMFKIAGIIQDFPVADATDGWQSECVSRPL